jgi:monofunctional biosynthetic peptidoglycan transglycosylase
MWPVYKLFKAFTKAVSLLFLALFLLVTGLQITIPDVSFLEDANPKVTNYMLSDEILSGQDVVQPIRFVALAKISPHLVRAILSSEDDQFFLHSGFNWAELKKALRTDWQKKRLVRGGSTISQQLARNLFLSKNKSIVRKLREWILTYEIEAALSKERILELYLNFVEYGPGIFGVEAASRYHFNTSPKNLSRAQAALLAGVLPNPKNWGKKPYPSTTFRRQNQILGRMNHFDLYLPANLFQEKPPKPEKELVVKNDKPIKNSTPLEKEKVALSPDTTTQEESETTPAEQEPLFLDESP